MLQAGKKNLRRARKSRQKYGFSLLMCDLGRAADRGNAVRMGLPGGCVARSGFRRDSRWTTTTFTSVAYKRPGQWSGRRTATILLFNRPSKDCSSGMGEPCGDML